jgi:hypothetical protein
MHENSTKRNDWPFSYRLVGASVVAAAYAFSFPFPVYEYSTNRFTGWDAFSSAFGAFILLIKDGREGITGIIYFLGWLPNLLMWIGLLCLLAGSFRRATFAGGIAVFLSLAIWTWTLPTGQFLGYYLWVASMVCLTLMGWVGGICQRMERSGNRRQFITGLLSFHLDMPKTA